MFLNLQLMRDGTSEEVFHKTEERWSTIVRFTVFFLCLPWWCPTKIEWQWNQWTTDQIYRIGRGRR